MGEKPNDALSYLKNSVGGSPSDKETIAKLREENEMLKQKVKELEASQATLESRVATLSAAGTSSSNATEEKEEEKTPAALATQTYQGLQPSPLLKLPLKLQCRVKSLNQPKKSLLLRPLLRLSQWRRRLLRSLLPLLPKPPRKPVLSRRKKVMLKLEASEDVVIPGIWGILTFYMETIL